MRAPSHRLKTMFRSTNRLVRRCLPGVLLLVASFATAAIAVGPERAIAPRTLDIAYGADRIMALASNGTDYLAIWRDGRARASAGCLRATRISGNGTVLDPAGLLLPLCPAEGTNVRAIWEGDRWAVFVADGSTLHRITVGETGTVDSAPFTALSSAEGYDIAWNGSSYLLARSGASGNSIGLTLHDRFGTVVQQISSPASGFPALPLIRVAANGPMFLVIWATADSSGSAPNNERLHAARISSSGQVLDPSSAILARETDIETIDVASNQRGTFLVVWDEASGAIRWRTMSSTTGSVGTTRTAPEEGEIGTVAWSGTHFILPRFDSPEDDAFGDIALFVIEPDGDLEEPEAIDVVTADGRQGDAVAASNGSNVLILFNDSRRSDESPSETVDVFGAFATTDGQPFDEVEDAGFPIAQSWRAQLDVAIASDGTNYLVVWEEAAEISARSELRYALVSAEGTPLTGSRILESSTRHQHAPAVSFDGANYLVVWNESGLSENTYAVRVTPGGHVLDATPLFIANGVTGRPAIASATKSSLIVVSRTSIGDSELYGAIVKADGSRVGPNLFLMTQTDHDSVAPDVAFDGVNYMVVWEEEREFQCRVTCNPDEDTTFSDVFALRISQSGLVLNAAPLEITDTEDADDEMPQLSWSGHEFIVVWSNRGSGVFGKVVSADGNLIGTTAGSYGTYLGHGGVAAETAAKPELIFDGEQFVYTAAADGVRVTVLDVTNHVLHVVSSDLIPLDGGAAVAVAAATRTMRQAMVAYVRLLRSDVFSGVQTLFGRTIQTIDPPRIRAARRR